MERAQDPALRNFVEIDQEVAAADKVQARERRIPCHVLPGEEAQVANVLRNPVVAVLTGEETLQAFGRDLLQRIHGVQARARLLQCPLADVGPEDLDPQRRQSVADVFEKRDGDGIDLLASRAAGHPDADRRSRRSAFTERGKHLLTQRLECGRITKELGDADQEFLEERGKLDGIAIERFAVLVEALDPSQHHSTLDAPPDCCSLVVGEVDAVRRAEPLEDVPQAAIIVAGDNLARGRWPAVEAWSRRAEPPAETRELPGYLLRAQHEVDTACLYRMPRHCRKRADSGSCAKVNPPAFLIPRSPREPSASPPESTTPMASSPYATASDEKKIDSERSFGSTRPPLRFDDAAVHREKRIRRDDVDVVGLHGLSRIAGDTAITVFFARISGSRLS